MDSWIILYGLLSHMLTFLGTQFVCKFFEFLYDFVVTNILTTVAYYPQTNGKVKRLIKTIVAKPWSYVREHQRDWDMYMLPMSYSCNAEVHCFTDLTPFRLDVSLPLRGLNTVNAPPELPNDATTITSPHAIWARLLQYVGTMQLDADKQMRTAQGCSKGDKN